MTIRRLMGLTLFALLFLGSTLATWALSRSESSASDQVLSTGLVPAASAAGNDAAGSNSGDNGATPAETPPITPEPIPEPVATEPAEVVRVAEPPALVQIPADLISTPTPDSATVVPLPFLTNIPAVPRDGSVVYLTFDDGPDPVYTNQVLDVLARYDAKATFFVIGNLVDAYPGVVQRMINEGHTVGNHTYYHEALPLQEPDQIAQTLGATDAAIARAVGHKTNCLRPPYGAMDQGTFDLVRGQGFTVHMWEVDSEDWKLNDSYTIASNVLTTTDLGDRILFHDGPSNRAATVGALESVLQVLTNRGVRFNALDC
jgi:peptidoglycan/xylan/chitin deacetylase (PgdA/CDA1 family)